MESNNYIDETFKIIDGHLRSASIADIGGSMLPNKPCMSWFGGRFVGKSGESWPETENGPMLPLIQVQINELPVVPEALQDIKLITVFLDSQQLQRDCPLANDDGWTIRAYDDLNVLERLEQPEISTSLHPTPIRWDLSSTEGPTWNDAQRLVEDGYFFQVRHSILLFHERYRFHPGTKIGGWPGWVQKSLADPEHYVMQIASEEKANWKLVEDGKYYVCFEQNEWLLYWDGF